MKYQEHLRVKLLRIIEEHPTHAYNLWKNYNYGTFPTQSSSFYRFLRMMIQEKYIEYVPRKGNKSTKCIPKTLKITKQGQQYLRDYEQSIIGQMLEMMFHKFSNHLISILELLGNIAKNFVYYIHTYFEARDLPFFSLIYNSIKKNRLRVVVMSSVTLPQDLIRRFPEITFLGTEFKPNNGTIDVLFSPDAYLFVRGDTGNLMANAAFDYRITEWRNFLKPSGLFLVLDTFPQFQGQLKEIINPIFDAMGENKPPLTTNDNFNWYRNYLQRFFPNITRSEALGISVLIGIADPSVDVEKLLKSVSIFAPTTN